MLAKTVCLAAPAGAVLAEPALFRVLSALALARLFGLSWRHRHIGANFTIRTRDRDRARGPRASRVLGEPPQRPEARHLVDDPARGGPPARSRARRSSAGNPPGWKRMPRETVPASRVAVPARENDPATVVPDQVHAAVGQDPQLEAGARPDPPAHGHPWGELGRRGELLVAHLGPAEEDHVVAGRPGRHGPFVHRVPGRMCSGLSVSLLNECRSPRRALAATWMGSAPASMTSCVRCAPRAGASTRLPSLPS